MMWAHILTAICVGWTAVVASPVLNTRAVSLDVFRNLAFYEQYSAAAYCSNNHEPASDSKISCSVGNCDEVQNAESYTIAEFEKEGMADATGFVAVDRTNRVIVVSFRGSRSIKNWILNAIMWHHNFLCEGCHVHQGFLSSWKATRDLVTRVVTDASLANPGFGIVVTGHSLGAAVATLAASQLRTKGLTVALYTYGSPMVGNRAYADFVTNQSGGNYRVTHQSDVIANFPGLFTAGYRHISPQFWITTASNITVTADDIQESSDSDHGNSHWDLPEMSFSDHVWYFNGVAACTPDLFDGLFDWKKKCSLRNRIFHTC